MNLAGGAFLPKPSQKERATARNRRGPVVPKPSHALDAARVGLEQEVARRALAASRIEDEIATLKAKVIGVGHELVLARADLRASIEALKGHDRQRRRQSDGFATETETP